jgi:hypothetical protein
VKATQNDPRDLSLPASFASVGALFAGAIGAIAGLVVGLVGYAPTAPFAAIELGVPATVAGGIAGLIVGAIASARRRMKQRSDPSA